MVNGIEVLNEIELCVPLMSVYSLTGKKLFKFSEGDLIDGTKPGFFIGDHPDEEQPDSITELPVTDPGQFNPGFMDEALGDEGDIQRKGSSKVSFHLGK